MTVCTGTIFVNPHCVSLFADNMLIVQRMTRDPNSRRSFSCTVLLKFPDSIILSPIALYRCLCLGESGSGQWAGLTAGGTHQSKWKSVDTRSLKSKKPESTNFSATFLTATFDCAITQTVFDGCSSTLLCTTAAMTVVFPVPGGP